MFPSWCSQYSVITHLLELDAQKSLICSCFSRCDKYVPAHGFCVSRESASIHSNAKRVHSELGRFATSQFFPLSLSNKSTMVRNHASVMTPNCQLLRQLWHAFSNKGITATSRNVPKLVQSIQCYNSSPGTGCTKIFDMLLLFTV